MYVWVLEQFGADGFRAVIQVFKTDTRLLAYVADMGDMEIERDVANGQKRIIFRDPERPKSSLRAIRFEVKT